VLQCERLHASKLIFVAFVTVWFLTVGGLPAVGAAVPPPRAAPKVVQYPTATPFVHPNKIAGGPDLAVWYTELNNASIARTGLDGASREFPVPDPDQFLRGITAGPDGAMWFAEEGTCIDDDCTDFTNGKIGRITTGGAITEFPVPSQNSHPWEITAGPDGNLWFTEIGDNLHFPGSDHLIEGNKIGRITPQGVVTEFPVPTFDSFPDGIAAGPDGALWFTENVGNKIGRITTSGTISEFPIPTAGSRPIGIATGSDGNLWFVERSGDKIGRITPHGAVTEFPLPSTGVVPVWITAGPDGALWFTEVVGQKIGRISTDGAITELPIPPGSFPAGITLGPSAGEAGPGSHGGWRGAGDVWFTTAVSSTVGRILVCEAVRFRASCATAGRRR